MKETEVRIDIDDSSGFCFGVVNAIGRAESSLREGGEVFSLGDIVHNRLEVQRLAALGLRATDPEKLDELAGKKVLIRAHGEPPATYRRAVELGIEVIDATCPVVAGLQRIVASAYRQMLECAGQVVILGKRGHAEVVGLSGHTGDSALIVEGMGDLAAVDFSRPVYFLAQTTQSLSLFREMADAILALSECPDQVVIRDTICRQVSSREAHLREFALGFDTVVFVSGLKSSNGKVLYEVCREANPNTYMVEDPEELQAVWFSESRSVGICGATSTPHWLMERVAVRTRELIGYLQ